MKYFKSFKIKVIFSLIMCQLICIGLVGCGDNAPLSDKELAEPIVNEVPKEQEQEQRPTADKQVESATEVEAEQTSEEIDAEKINSDKIKSEAYDFTLCFAGDINLDENWYTTQYLDTCPNGIYDCIDSEFIDAMQSADMMILNNEFTFSDRGKPFAGKHYTFRAFPDRVSVMQELGVDAVYLANNHAYDWGKDALLDTFDTLDGAGIKYFGAGHNLEEAMTPLYVEIQGKKIAFVAASRAADIVITPQAKEDAPGILQCYDTTLFLQVIEEAAKNADIVIAIPHWGTEGTHELEKVQKTTGKEYLDAGATVIVGDHPHVLQGIEDYNGKYIFYSLGNYWFNAKTMDTMLLQLRFYSDENGDDCMEVHILPGTQSECQTRYAKTPEEHKRVLDLLRKLSPTINIDEDGYVTPKAEE